MKNEFEKLKQ